MAVFLNGQLVEGPLTPEQLRQINPGFWLVWSALIHRMIQDGRLAAVAAETIEPAERGGR